MNLDLIWNFDAFLEQVNPICIDEYTDIVIYKAEEVYKAFLFSNDLTDNIDVYSIFERRMRREKPEGVAFIG